MSERSAMFLIITGLLFTAFGVGGVENSVTDADLITSVIVSSVGLAVMYCGTRGLRRS